VDVRLDKSQTAWIVIGHIPGALDGVFAILIRKSDGKILDLDLGFGKVRWYKTFYYNYYDIRSSVWSLKFKWGI